MNKQEVIMKLEEKDNNAYEKQQAYLTESTLFQRYEAQRIAYRTAINYVEQLDEPQKVKVPAFVAEYIESHRKWGPEIFIGDWLADNDDVDKWLYNNSEKENNRRFLIAVKAFVEGYEIEEEPKYRVSLPLTMWDDDAAMLNETTMFLAFDITSDETRFFHSPKNFDDYRTELTECEIKSIDERYWQFAVPIKKEVAE